MKKLYCIIVAILGVHIATLMCQTNSALEVEGPIRGSLFQMKNIKILPANPGFDGVRFENDNEILGSISPSIGNDPPSLDIKQVRIGDIKILNHTFNDLDDLWIRKAGDFQDVQLMRLGSEISAINTDDLFLSSRVHVSFPSHATGQSGLQLSNTGSNANYWHQYVSNSNGNLEFWYKGIIKGKIQSSNGAYVQGSDRRLKTSIAALPSVLEKIMHLKARTYQFIDDPNQTHSIGFVAQEVAEYFPELVKTLGEEHDFLGLSYQDFSVLAIKAIQELNRMNKALVEKVDSQECKLMEFASRLNKSRKKARRLR